MMPNGRESKAIAVKIKPRLQETPRKKDGSEPLMNAAHEQLAQFMASTKAEREFSTVVELAQHLDVTAKTVHAWKNRIDVLVRAEYLSKERSRHVRLIIRRELPEIAEALVNAARGGNVRAIRLCLEEVSTQLGDAVASFSVAELFADMEDDEVAPSGAADVDEITELRKMDEGTSFVVRVSPTNRSIIEEAMQIAARMTPDFEESGDFLQLICERFIAGVELQDGESNPPKST